MPSLPGLAPKPSNATHIPSPLSSPSHQRYHQQHSSSTLAASPSFSSSVPSPSPGPEQYAQSPRSHSRLESPATQQQDGDGRFRRGQTTASGSGSNGGSFGRKGGLRSRRSGGGFLLGMGAGYSVAGETASPLPSERDGMRSASDPISNLRHRNNNSESEHYYNQPESSSSRQGNAHRHQTTSPNTSLAGDILSNSSSVDTDTAHLLDELLANDNDPAEIVSMAVGMSENRKTLLNSNSSRGATPASEGTVLPNPNRTTSSGSRSGSSRPFLTSALSQTGEPRRRRSKTPSGFLSPLNPRSRSPQSPNTNNVQHPQTLEASRRYISQASAMTLMPPSPSMPFHQQQVKMNFSFNQYQVPIVASPSTLARAAKARQYLELFVQYLNLLHSLPPATDTHAQQPSNNHHHHYYHSNSSQHSAHVAPIHPLRRYNPLQTIRNRRLRNRLGLGQLDISPWEDAGVVNQWIEKSTAHREEENKGEEGIDVAINSNKKISQQASEGRLLLLPPPQVSPPEKPKAKPKRLKMDWYVHPAEMFADFYWINECSGKGAMEDRLGGRIFPNAAAPASSVAGSSSGGRIVKVGGGERDASAGSGPGGILGKERGGNVGGRKGGSDDSWNSPQSNRDRMGGNTLGGKDGWGYESGDLAGEGGRGRPRDDSRNNNNITRDMMLGGREVIIGSPEYQFTDPGGNNRRGELDLVLPAGPGITIGIGGGNLSTDESSDSSDSEAGFARGRTSVDSKRYSSHFEDDSVVAGLRQNQQQQQQQQRSESPDRAGMDAGGGGKKQHNHHHHHHHHHHLYAHFSHRSRSRRRSKARKAKDGEGDLSAVDTDESSASDGSSTSSGAPGKRVHKRWTLHKNHNAQKDEDGNTSDTEGSSDDEAGKASRTPRNGLRAIGRRVRNKIKKADGSHDPDHSDSETNYESAAAVSGISRSPSPAIPQLKEIQQQQQQQPRLSLDSEGRSPRFLQPSPQPARNSLAPPSMGGSASREKSPSRSSFGGRRGGPSRSPSPGVAVIEDRGRKKPGKDETGGILLKRRMSPTKGLFSGRRSSEYSFDDHPTEGHGSRRSSIGKRDSKDFEREVSPSKGKDKKEKEKEKNKTLSTVKKAKERVGNRVEKIKNGVGGFVRGGKDTASQPSSHYASSVGSAGGMSDKEEASDDEEGEKVKRSRLSLDIENMFRNQKKRSAKPHGHKLNISLPNFDVDFASGAAGNGLGTGGTATGSDASLEVEGEVPEDYWMSGAVGLGLGLGGRKVNGRDIPMLRVLGPSRQASHLTRRSTSTGTALEERKKFGSLGVIRSKRQRSRLAEEIARGAGAGTGEEDQGDAPPVLGRVKIPPIATRQAQEAQAPPQRRYLGRKDLARAKALMLSTGILARGMASQVSPSSLSTNTPSTTTTSTTPSTLHTPIQKQRISAKSPPPKNQQYLLPTVPPSISPPSSQQSTPTSPSEFTGTLTHALRKHTHTAHLLSSKIHAHTTRFDHHLAYFTTHTLAHLQSQIASIATQLEAQLTPLVQQTADEADALNAELSYRYTLEVKRLGDEVAMLARRRRRTGLKWVRRGGYLLLEWTVLGVMWWVWMVVVAVRLVRMVVGGVGRGVKWVLWL